MFMRRNTEKRGRIERRSTRISASSATAALIFVACIALIGTETSRLVSQREEIVAEAEKETANLASSLTQHAELTFRVAEALLIGAAERLEHDGLDPQHRKRMETWFVEEARHSPQFIGFSVIDRDGTMVVSSLGHAAMPGYSDREYFLYHQLHADREVRIGAPTLGRVNKQWMIPLTLRFDRADGSFGGIVVAAIDPQYFQNFYDRLQIGNNGAVLLASLNGKLLVRRPFVESNIGRDLSRAGIFLQLQQAPAGTAEITSATDGVRRINSYERGKTYPIVIAVAKDKDEVLAPWRENLMRRLGETVAMIVLIALLGTLAWRSTRTLAAKAVKLRDAIARFDAAINSMSQGLCLYDSDQRIIIANTQYAEIYGLSPDQISPGTLLDDIFRYREEKGTGFERTDDLMNATLGDDLSEVKELNDGRVISVFRHILQDGGLLSIHEDITARAHNEKQIAYLAEHDQLTGLANRHHFSKFLAEISENSKRKSDKFAVFMLDLDRFKAVNDTLGHAAGDLLLTTIAGRLKACTRETDLVARLGGDEFAIVQNIEDHGHEAAIALALRIVEAVAEPIDLNGTMAGVGTSIGIAICPEHGRLPDDLMKKADLALYATKAAGRNDFRIYNAAMSASDDDQKARERDLRDALQREEFELHYQPVVELATGLVCGAEALVRWRHPTKGLIPPDQFIPLAESTGLIVPLGEWILQKACGDAASWKAPLKVAVNISAIQFSNGKLFDVVLCTLVDTGLPPARLELELTESVLLDQEGNHAQTIRHLRNVGITMVMDDFGTGYSSASYLTNFAFGKIKLDRSFVKDMATHRESAAVIASMLALAKGLGIETTAEGVETEEQMELLRAAGVTYGQGFYFGRPVPDFGRCEPDLAGDASSQLHRQIA